MSINQNVLGLIFASINDSAVIDLTKLRTMGSIPYGGRYRMVDFPLSNMVNSGISEVGVITKSNYGSLLDHLGSGREWGSGSEKGRSAPAAAVQSGRRRYLSGSSGSTEQYLEFRRTHQGTVCHSGKQRIW